MGTRRAQMIDYLERSEYTVKELAALIKSSTRDTLDDLSHIKRSVGARMNVRAAECTSCHFAFRKRERFNAPSRCPHCKSERIVGPWLSITPEKKP